MVDYTDFDLKRAMGIVEGLRTEERREGWPRDDLEDGVSIADLQAHARLFYDDLDLLEEINLDFPALRLGDKSLVPLSLWEVTANWGPLFALPVRSWRHWRRLFPTSYLRDSIINELRRREDRFEDAGTLSPDEAQRTFSSRASDFLASRFAVHRMSAEGWPSDQPRHELTMAKFIGGPRTTVSGCLFSVHTKSPGLTAYWSGAYYISSNYHGAPTTPVKGVLQAGTYVFGVNGGAYGATIRWDTKAVCTLPGTPTVRLQF